MASTDDRVAGRASEVEITRDGNRVSVTLPCADDYAAILLYDKLLAELHAGHMELTLTRPPGPSRAAAARRTA